MKIYQTRIAVTDVRYTVFPNKGRDFVEIFRPHPHSQDLGDSVDSRGVKRKRLMSSATK
ncbi:hypothetical protein Tsubulata_018987 [Turnera subulata]|uniref:Uncharacterized protein n=1 Tax=Turnera subulata TaxID=218843 RepID=A0A9Q0JNU1_9ROSI|nr:hypothetical protein Tsubulata_018987 [Turnera subulata]